MTTQHFNMLTEPQHERLAILVEDCAEVIHIAQKIMRHGYESTNPTKPVKERITNRGLLEVELGQLEWIIKQMLLADDINVEYISDSKESRAEKIAPYIHHFKIRLQ